MILLPGLIKAQVSISAQLPPAGFVQPDQLWNLILINNRQDMLSVGLKMNVQDAVSGQSFLTASTGNIILGKAAKNITYRDIQPVMYNFNVPGVSKNSLPVGSYIVCYQIVADKDQAVLAEECVRFNVDPLSPPLLNTPADKSQINDSYPQFTWMPPAPMQMFTNLNYQIVVTEILPDQDPVQAILYNKPIFFKNNIRQPYQPYPPSFTKLDTSKRYAWQVTAQNDANYAAKTEVWTFSFKNDEMPHLVTSETFALLADEDAEPFGGIYRVKNNVLTLKYYSFTGAHEGTVQIMSSDGKIMFEEKEKISYGENFYKIKISKQFEKQKIYRGQISEADGKKYFVLFTIE